MKIIKKWKFIFLPNLYNCTPAPTCCRVVWFCGNKTHSNTWTSEPDFGVRIPYHQNSDIPSGFVNNLLLHLKGLHPLGFSLLVADVPGNRHCRGSEDPTSILVLVTTFWAIVQIQVIVSSWLGSLLASSRSLTSRVNDVKWLWLGTCWFVPARPGHYCISDVK